MPNIKMNPPQVYMCSPSWTLLLPSSPYHPSGSSQCISPKHPVSCIKPGLATCYKHDILHVFNWIFFFFFLPLRWMNCSYVVDINHLSDGCFSPILQVAFLFGWLFLTCRSFLVACSPPFLLLLSSLVSCRTALPTSHQGAFTCVFL